MATIPGLLKSIKKKAAEAKRAAAAERTRIERAYYASCSGIQISILDIGKVFEKGSALIAANPTIDDDALSQGIYDFVQTIRKN